MSPPEMPPPNFYDQMALGLPAKLFFADQIEFDAESDVIVDFGCGDGALLRAFNDLRVRDGLPRVYGVNYDARYQAVRRGLDFDNGTEQGSACVYTADAKTAVAIIGDEREKGMRVTLILSSVLHECSDEDVAPFVALADRVVVRDFACDDRSGDHDLLDASDLRVVTELVVNDLKDGCALAYLRRHGFPQSEGGLLRYALYRAWPGEVDEDYFCVTAKRLQALFSGFKSIYWNVVPNVHLQRVAEESIGKELASRATAAANNTIIYERKEVA